MDPPADVLEGRHGLGAGPRRHGRALEALGEVPHGLLELGDRVVREVERVADAREDRLLDERGAFGAFQAALTLASLLAALAWIEQQEWWQTTSLRHRDPRALHAFGLALGALAVGYRVHLEADVIAKHVHRLVAPYVGSVGATST